MSLGDTIFTGSCTWSALRVLVCSGDLQWKLDRNKKCSLIASAFGFIEKDFSLLDPLEWDNNGCIILSDLALIFIIISFYSSLTLALPSTLLSLVLLKTSTQKNARSSQIAE